MAIKVNGTTVINDSRALSNIASVDATTVAALGAAGVGGGKNNVLNELFVSSGSYTVPFDCDLYVLACGAGGGGAACQTGSNGGSGRATGGAAGGLAIRVFTGVSSGDVVSMTIGAKGENGQLPNTSGAVTSNGSSGGNTSVTYSGTTLTGNGGGGGTAAANSTDLTSNGGGSASGGTTNITGGTSSTGYLSVASGDGNRKASSGAMASVVSSAQGAANLDHAQGTGNFSGTPLNGHNYTRNQAFEIAYGTEGDVPGPSGDGNYYSLNPLYFGINSAGGGGATNFDGYAFTAAGMPGHLGGGGGGTVHGASSGGSYLTKGDDNVDNDGARGGRGGIGFVHLVLLSAAEDL